MKSIVVSAVILFFCGFSSAGAQAQFEERPQFQKVQIEISNSRKKMKLQLEAALTPEQQAYGLMNLNKLAPNAGMIFVFASEQYRAFWMKNTLIDLDIAYIGADKTIIDIQQMKAVKSIMQTDLPSYPSRKPAQYAIEMNQGWFKKNGFEVGSKIKILTRLKSK